MLDKVLDQLHDYGLQPDQPLIFGKLTRCRTQDDKGKEKNGWYVLHEHLTEKGKPSSSAASVTGVSAKRRRSRPTVAG